MCVKAKGKEKLNGRVFVKQSDDILLIIRYCYYTYSIILMSGIKKMKYFRRKDLLIWECRNWNIQNKTVRKRVKEINSNSMI